MTAVPVGVFLPFFIRGNFDQSIIRFPHLAEWFELITIITFGEEIVGMTDFFDVTDFSLRPILVFAVIRRLFGCYVTQIHYMCNHHRVDRALRLMINHYFVVISKKKHFDGNKDYDGTREKIYRENAYELLNKGVRKE